MARWMGTGQGTAAAPEVASDVGEGEPRPLLPPGESRPPGYRAKNRALAPQKAKGRPWPSSSPMLPASPIALPSPPRRAFQSRGEMTLSHFPREELKREPGPSEAQNRAAFTGPLAEAPLLGSKQTQEEREQTQRENGEDLKTRLGCPPPAPGGLSCWVGRKASNELSSSAARVSDLEAEPNTANLGLSSGAGSRLEWLGVCRLPCIGTRTGAGKGLGAGY